MLEEKLYIEYDNIIDQLVLKKLDQTVHITFSYDDIAQYVVDIRFEPFFLIEKASNGTIVQKKYSYRAWNPISTLKTDIKKCFNVRGFKLLPLNDNQTQEIQTDGRRESLKQIKKVFGNSPVLRVFDLSEINGENVFCERMTHTNVTVINYRGSKNQNDSYNSNTTKHTLNLRGISKIESARGARVILDYTHNLFQQLVEGEIIPDKELIVFLRHRYVITKNFVQFKKLHILSKQKGFLLVLFTEDRILLNDRDFTSRFFLNAQLNAPNRQSELFAKRNYYTSVGYKQVNFRKGTPNHGYSIFNQRLKCPMYDIDKNDWVLSLEGVSKNSEQLYFLTGIIALNPDRLKMVNLRLDQLFFLAPKLQNLTIKTVSLTPDREGSDDFFASQIDINEIQKLHTNHLKIPFEYDFKKVLSFFYMEGIQSILFDARAKLSLNDIKPAINLKSLYLMGIDTIDFDLVNHFPRLKTVILKWFKTKPVLPNYMNIWDIFLSSTIRTLYLEIPIDLLETKKSEMIINESIEFLTMPVNLIEETFSKVIFNGLKDLVIEKIGYGFKIDRALDFKFLVASPSLEKLSIFYDCDEFTNSHLLPHTSIKELIVTINYPEDFEGLKRIKVFLKDVERIRFKSLKIRILNFQNGIDEFLPKIFEDVSLLVSKLDQLLLTWHEMPILGTFGESHSMCFDFSKVRKYNKLELLLKSGLNEQEYYYSILGSMERKSTFTDKIFPSVYKWLKQRYGSLEIYIDGIEIPTEIFEKSSLSIYSSIPTNLGFSSLRDEYFLNKKFQISSTPITVLGALSLKEIKLINVRLTDMAFFTKYTDVFHELQRVFVSELAEIFIKGLTENEETRPPFVVPNLKEIILLDEFLDASEKERIPFYKEKMKKKGIEVIVRSTPIPIKAHTDKIIFGTEIGR